MNVSHVRKLSNELEMTMTENDENVIRMLNKCNFGLGDTAYLLPDAQFSEESLSFKNCVFELDGNVPQFPHRAFSNNWCSGVSAVHVPYNIVEDVLMNKSASERSQILAKLRDRIPNEITDRNVIVGPKLQTDENDRDIEDWTAGFDTSNCCLGLYACEQERQTEGANFNAQRAHKEFYIVCKAGAGRAAQEFSDQLAQYAQESKSLNQVLGPGGILGEEVMRRVSIAARRNRARLLKIAADELGLGNYVDNVIDNAGYVGSVNRHAIVDVDSYCNVLVPADKAQGTQGNWLYYAGSIPTTQSQGLLSCNTAQLGFLLFHTSEAQFDRLQRTNLLVSNVAYNALPFSTPRDLPTNVALKNACDVANPDNAWIRSRFAWKSASDRLLNTRSTDAQTAEKISKIEPPQLQGTHRPAKWPQTNARELGIITYINTKLRPELVVLPGTEPEKLRSLMRSAARPVQPVTVDVR